MDFNNLNQKLSKIFEHDHLKGENTDAELLHEDIIPFLLLTTNGDVPVFISGNGFFIYSILVPTSQIPGDPSELAKFSIMFDSTYGYSSSFKPQLPDDFGLSSPGELYEPDFLKDGIPMTFLRDYRFNEKKSYIELPQDFIHMFRLHKDDETDNMCRINDDGDKEEICRIQLAPYYLVTVKSEVLFAYLHLKKYSLVRVFDSMRSKGGSPHWTKYDRIERSDKPNGIYAYFQDSPSDDCHCSMLRGGQIIGLDRDFVWKYAKNELIKTPDNRCCEFIAVDWKNDRIATFSCSPESLSNYFEHKNDKPFETSPVFFKPEVLDKYKNNPYVYCIEGRSISKIDGWSLQTYDINDQGQVHTYLVYLSHLPYDEQMYWKSFNEEPKGPISVRAYQNDFKGEFSEIQHPDEILVQLLERVKTEVSFYHNLDTSQLKRIHRVHTDNQKEWNDSVFLMDKVLVETLDDSVIKSIAIKLKCYDSKLKSIKQLQAIYSALNFDEEKLAPLGELHHLRCKVTDHLQGFDAKQILKDIRKRFKSFQAHFDDLLSRLCESLNSLLDFNDYLVKREKEGLIKE